MIVLQKYLKQSATYKLFSHFLVVFASFLETLGQIAQLGFHTLKCVLKGEIDFKENACRLASKCASLGKTKEQTARALVSAGFSVCEIGRK